MVQVGLPVLFAAAQWHCAGKNDKWDESLGVPVKSEEIRCQITHLEI